MRIANLPSRRALYAGLIIGVLLATGSLLVARQGRPTTTTQVCADDNGGITLAAGFCATVFADNIGHARHLVVAPNGVVYVNTWSGRYYGNATASRPAAAGALASRSTAARSSQRSTIASCDMACPPRGSCPRRRRR